MHQPGLSMGSRAPTCELLALPTAAAAADPEKQQPPKKNEKQNFGREHHTQSTDFLPGSGSQARMQLITTWVFTLVFNPRTHIPGQLWPLINVTQVCAQERSQLTVRLSDSGTDPPGQINLTLLFLAHFCQCFHIFIIFVFKSTDSPTSEGGNDYD